MTKTKTPQVISIPTARIHFDPENANRMPEHEYATLVSNIKQAGHMLQPVLVKERDDGDYDMVDGEHRTRASADAGLTHVLAVVWDGTEAMRKAIALSFNKIRGELDLTAVQRILASLHEEGWSVKEMTMTGYREDEIGDLLKLSNDISPDDIMQNPISPSSNEDEEPREAKPLMIELTFATVEDMKFAKKGLRRAAGKGRDLSDGLLKLLGKDD